MSYGLNVPALFQRAAELLNKNPARNQTRRYPGRATDDVQARRQPQDRRGAWFDDPESFLLRADTVAGTKCEFRLVRVTTAHE